MYTGYKFIDNENFQRLTFADRMEFTIESASDYMLATNDYSIETAQNLVNAIYKNFGIRPLDEDNPFESTVIDTLREALQKKGESEGYNGVDYYHGIVGFDTSGCSTRNWIIQVSDAGEKLAAASFDAGRKFAETENYKLS